MLDTADYRVSDVAWARALVRDVGWGTLVSTTSAGLVASHLPLLVDAADDLTVVGHLGRPDDVAHEIADAAAAGREVLITVEGPSGYVSPSWYAWGPAVPTWNFLAVHLWGVPEVLSASETYDVLRATVDRFESERPSPWALPDDGDGGAYARRLAPGTLGFRVRAARWQGKAKLSQDKPPEVAARVIAALESDPVHGDRALAAAMRDVHGARSPGAAGLAAPGAAGPGAPGAQGAAGAAAPRVQGQGAPGVRGSGAPADRGGFVRSDNTDAPRSGGSGA